MYRVEVNGTDYVAPDIKTLQQWATEGRLLPETMVWVEAQQNHLRASQVPGLYFTPATQPSYEQPPAHGNAPYLRQGYAGPPPPNHLVWAILATVLCCMPLGVASLVFAAQVDGQHARGEYQKAIDSSNKAKTFAIISAATGVLLTVGWIVVAIAGGGF